MIPRIELNCFKITKNLFQQFQFTVSTRNFYDKFVDYPKPGEGKAYRRKVHYPKEYTVKPLEVTNLAGRDPETGRVIVHGIGGGIKHKFHWISWNRSGPKENPPLEEKVIQILKCGCRTAHVALVATGDKLKYILATENMKAGDILKTSQFIPKNPVLAKEGDAYPLGALPKSTIVHNIQMHPSSPVTIVHSAGSCAKIIGTHENKIVVQLPSKRQVALEQECMATVGRISNVKHATTPIGSAQKWRELGNRPKSGLWHRKTGRFGRKIKPPKKLKVITEKKQKRSSVLLLTEKVNR